MTLEQPEADFLRSTGFPDLEGIETIPLFHKAVKDLLGRPGSLIWKGLRLIS